MKKVYVKAETKVIPVKAEGQLLGTTDNNTGTAGHVGRDPEENDTTDWNMPF